MDYAIEIILERFNRLNSFYDEFVERGHISYASNIATSNREKAKGLERALLYLQEKIVEEKKFGEVKKINIKDAFLKTKHP